MLPPSSITPLPWKPHHAIYPPPRSEPRHYHASGRVSIAPLPPVRLSVCGTRPGSGGRLLVAMQSKVWARLGIRCPCSCRLAVGPLTGARPHSHNPIIGDHTMQRIFTDMSPEQTAKRVARDRFAWPGGYALGVVCVDGGMLCSACVAENLSLMSDPGDPQWYPAEAYIADADDDLYDVRCDNCHRPITDATNI